MLKVIVFTTIIISHKISLSNTELDNLKESINKSVFNELYATLESFLIKSVIGDSTEGGSVKVFCSNLLYYFWYRCENNSVLYLEKVIMYPLQNECVVDRTTCRTWCYNKHMHKYYRAVDNSETIQQQLQIILH